jgi:hypothetical protein
MKLGTAVFIIFVFGVIVMGAMLPSGTLSSSGGYSKPEHCTGCSLDSKGNLTREFVITTSCDVCAITSSPKLQKSTPEEQQAILSGIDSDFGKLSSEDFATFLGSVSNPVFTLSADGDSIKARCIGGRIEKSLHTEVTHGCHDLLTHLNGKVKLTYHISGGGEQNEDAFYYYTTPEGWKAEEELDKLDGRVQAVCTAGEMKFDTDTQIGCVGKAEAPKDNAHQYPPCSQRGWQRTSRYCISEPRTYTPTGSKAEECAPIGSYSINNGDGTKSSPVTKDEYEQCMTAPSGK